MKISNMVRIGLLVCLGTISVQANVIFNEEFDGNFKTYDNNSTDGAGDGWTDFNLRIRTTYITPLVEGFTTATTGESVLAAGVRSGQNDPQIRSAWDVSLDASSATNVSMRIRIDRNKNLAYDDGLIAGDFDVYITDGTTKGLRLSSGVTTSVSSADANGWVVVDYSFAEETLGTISALRIDPVNNIPGSSFEIDYLKIEAIPEPATIGLVAAFGGGILVIRRRLMM